MMQGGEGTLLLSLSPSFSSYSSGRFAEIAARVVEEMQKDQSDSDPDIFEWKPDAVNSLQNGREPEEFDQKPQHDGNGGTETVVGEIGDDEFEFAVVPREPQAITISAEDIFCNGQIRPIYPVFNNNLLLNGSIIDKNGEEEDEENLKKLPKSKRVHRPSLGKLMSEEPNSCSSSEADELDGVLPGTYCVWSPKESLERCKKSNSMGSSKRWKLRDLLHRSNSDGKDTFVFLSSSKRVEKIAEVSKAGDDKTAGKVKPSRVAAAAASVAAAANVTPTAADEREHVNSASKGADKKSQSIPYRQEMVDLFNNVNGTNKNSHQF